MSEIAQRKLAEEGSYPPIQCVASIETVRVWPWGQGISQMEGKSDHYQSIGGRVLFVIQGWLGCVNLGVLPHQSRCKLLLLYGHHFGINLH